MYGDSNPISRLNAVENNENNKDEREVEDEELRMFTSTTFFDLDMGRSTDIATTVDELLMQQEKQLQYPRKNRPVDAEGATRPVAGPSRTERYDIPQDQAELSYFQRFSLAEELPPTNLYDIDPIFRNGAQSTESLNTNPAQSSIYSAATPQNPAGDQSHRIAINNLLHNTNGPHPNSLDSAHLHGNPVNRQNHVESHVPHLEPHPDSLHVPPPRHNLIQRHELAEQYAPQEQYPSNTGPSIVPHYDILGAPSQPQPPVVPIQSASASSSHRSSSVSFDDKKMAVDPTPKPALTDNDKRRRNTAASARFRIKKKEREKEMEKAHREMAKRIEDMELKMRQLETENEWLKKLALERNEARTVDTLDTLRQQLKDSKPYNKQ